MQVENDDREVYNGDLGIVQRVDEEEAGLVVAFDGREVRYGVHRKASQCRLAVPRGLPTTNSVRTGVTQSPVCTRPYRWCWLEGARLLNTDYGSSPFAPARATTGVSSNAVMAAWLAVISIFGVPFERIARRNHEASIIGTSVYASRLS
jgi:hypothetical protein